MKFVCQILTHLSLKMNIFINHTANKFQEIVKENIKYQAQRII